MGSNFTVAIWNIKDGSELYKIRSIKNRTKSTIIMSVLCSYQLTTPTTVLGIAKDSTLELIETNMNHIAAPPKIKGKAPKKPNMINIRTLFDVNSFLKSPIKGLKLVDVSCLASRPYITVMASQKEIFLFEIKRNSLPSSCVLNTKVSDGKIMIDYMINKNKRIDHYELELDIEDDKVKSNKLNLKGALEPTYPADMLIKSSPCNRYYSVEYIDNGVFEIYLNNVEKARPTIRKVLTGAGYNLVWSAKFKMFAVVSFMDDSLEAFDVNADALNHPIAKQKLTKTNIKSSVVIFRIESDKPRKIFVFQKCQCYHLYSDGPVLGMCINYEMPKDEEDNGSNILSPNKALLFFSWTSQKPVTSPLEPPEHLTWSDDSKYCIMAYTNSV
jgi:hypothetical protein